MYPLPKFWGKKISFNKEQAQIVYMYFSYSCYNLIVTGNDETFDCVYSIQRQHDVKNLLMYYNLTNL